MKNIKDIKIDREYIEIYPVNWQNINQRMVNEIFSNRSFDFIKEISLYVHIPFCSTVCPFCKFNISKYEPSIYRKYLKALKKEISLFRDHPDLRNRVVTAIYFGGGTGSMLVPDEIYKILNLMNKIFPISNKVEITVECHPDTIDFLKLKDYRKVGVNRISLGIQSFQDQNLRNIGRTHSARQNEKLLKYALKIGFNCVAMDLMYRLPGQDFENLKFDLNKIKEFSPDGISVYSLEPENTPLERKTSEMPSEEIDRKMFYFIGDFLENIGYCRFMQPDFSKPDKECKYVLNAWRAPQQLMVGFGAGANTHCFGNYVWANVYPVKSYIESIESGHFPGAMGIKVSLEELKAKYMVLGARHLSIEKKVFKEIFGESISDKFSSKIERLKKLGWISEENNYYKITREGLYYIDNISKMFYDKANKGKEQPWLKGLYNYIPKKFYKISKS
ncbi:MAG: radical SAM family heme chaperone HemW [Candidatus Pacebacteria bacterium]|nr:radical SAM family heme chaperone HemW [Candidatus Paceibacterota bacterium]